MHITYSPKDSEGRPDGPPQEWDFEPGDIRASVAEMIEKRFGENYDQWLAGVQFGNMRARRVLLWHLLRINHPTLRYEDTPDFAYSEVEVGFSVKELTDFREKMLKAAVPEDKREAALTAIDVQMTEAMEREQRSAEGSGKALSRTSAGDGGTPSPLN